MARVDSEKNVWLATVRPDGRPHLTPIWFAFVDDTFWICRHHPGRRARRPTSGTRGADR